MQKAFVAWIVTWELMRIDVGSASASGLVQERTREEEGWKS